MGGTTPRPTLGSRTRRQAFYRHRIVPRMLVDTNTRDTAAEILGRKVSAPIGFAPIGINKICNAADELPVAKVAKELILPYWLSAHQGCGRGQRRGPTLLPAVHPPR
ncbi:FMN-dependent dehydrogenase [Lasiodiplodia theobromae]|uniref:Peroxisomal (S)-2-hydroxy-acid oxidase GLO3 n=1 Tax=Lasiodiplodia theobromae TaxID=45133 RepID=A0A5N5DDM1_9PEZI|nr:Peroxisomal (S)-2-hydroxy-acid oxidase GLO3 [Lasiodiplodia theobromae]KAF9637360.1 FMN-dependent dehydrogenase [Lasiodiplodia theobromae]